MASANRAWCRSGSSVSGALQVGNAFRRLAGVGEHQAEVGADDGVVGLGVLRGGEGPRGRGGIFGGDFAGGAAEERVRAGQARRRSPR